MDRRLLIEDSYSIREATGNDIPDLLGFLLKLDAHVAGVDSEVLALNAEGERQLTHKLRDMIANPFTLVLVAERRPGSGLLAMGDVAIWHQADLWKNPERRGVAYAIIDDLWVEPEARNGGLGQALVAKLVDFAAANGIENLMLEYATTNAEAQATWSRLGFRTTGVRAAASVADVRARLSGPGDRDVKRESTDDR